jgi:CHAT domain-containing protein/tetratricopeptide (TPR) repeat protein
MEAIERGLKYSGVYKELAYAYEKAYGNDEALSMLGRLSRRSPRSAGFHYAVAVELWNKGDFRPVVARLKEAVALDSGQSRYGDALAVAELHLGYSRRKAERVEERRVQALSRGDISGSQFLVSSLLSDQIYAGDHRRRDAVLQESTIEASEFGFLRWLGWNLQKRADIEALASNYETARRLALTAKEIALRSQETDLQFVAVKRICGTFFEQGIYDSALHYAKVWSSESARSRRKVEYISSLGRIAQAYHALGQYQLALEYVIESIAEADVSRIDAGTQAEIETIFGAIQESLGNLPSAMSHHMRAASALRASTPLPYSVAANLGNLGQVSLRGKDAAKGARLLRLQLKILRGLDYPAEMAMALLNWGDYFFARGQLDSARAQYYASLDLADKVRNWQLEFDALRKIASTETAIGNASLAIAAYSRLAIVGKRGRDNGKLDFPELTEALKEKAVAEFRLGLLDEGIKTLESVRYLEIETYWESSIGRLRRQFPGRPLASAIESSKRLVQAVEDFHLQEEAPATTPASRVAQLSAMAQVFDARLSVCRDAEALSSFPDRKLNWSSETEDPVLTMRSFLRESPSVVVQYLISGQSIIAVVATSDSTFSISLPSSFGKIKAALRSFSRIFHHTSGPIPMLHPSIAAFDYGSGHLLYRQLLEPVLKSVRGQSRLVILADGLLRNLPFEALVTRPMKSGESPAFLVQDFEVSYCFSLGQLRKPLGAQEATKSVLLIGNADIRKNVVEEVPLQFSRNLVEARDFYQLGLPAARDEIHAVARLLAPMSKVIEGDDATKEHLIRELSKHDIVHVATHGVFDWKNPELSGIALTEQQRDRNRGVLTINELRLAECNAELIVLSGCNTGRVSNSGSVISLGLAATVVGCHASIASLWELQDDISEDLMTQFYRSLVKGASASSALRNAKLAVIAQGRADPFFWANYVLTGYPSVLPCGVIKESFSTFAVRYLSSVLLTSMLAFFGSLLALLLVTAPSGRIDKGGVEGK